MNSSGQNTVLCRCCQDKWLLSQSSRVRKPIPFLILISSRALKINKLFNALFGSLAGLPTHILWSLGQPSLQWYQKLRALEYPSYFIGRNPQFLFKRIFFPKKIVILMISEKFIVRLNCFKRLAVISLILIRFKKATFSIFLIIFFCQKVKIQVDFFVKKVMLATFRIRQN